MVESKLSVMPTMVSFHTYGWIQDCVTSYLDFFPAHKILVVDNNPCRNDGKSGFYRPKDPGWQYNVARCGENGSVIINGRIANKAGWSRHCEYERNWLAEHPSVVLISPPQRSLTHGQAIDFAVQWHREHKTQVMLYFEPDCLISSQEWYYALLGPLGDDGFWMTYSDAYDVGSANVCPSMWLVDKIPGTFNRTPYGDDLQSSLFNQHIVRSEKTWHFQGQGESMRNWTTGGKNWFEFLKNGRTGRVPAEGFSHFRDGTLKKREFVPPKGYSNVALL